MQVLHLSVSDLINGAGTSIAMQRLHKSLRKEGIESKILCYWKTTDSPHSVALSRPFFIKKMEGVLRRITTRLGLNDLHHLSSFRLAKLPLVRNADVAHLHCLHGGLFFNYLALPGLTKDTPTIYTFHDMWAITGHCSYSFDCDRWKTGCGSCPYPDLYPEIQRDNTKIEWKLKKWAFHRSTIHIVCPSRWMADQVKQSMVNDLPVHHIPNGLDTSVFKPLDKQECREQFGIPSGKKVLMFSAVNLKDTRKGGDLLLEALQSLPETLKSEVVLLLVGDKGLQIADLSGIEAIQAGYIRDERVMAAAYSAADLFLFPTRADNLPQVLQESLACGTPAISFRVGGVPEIIDAGINGDLAPSGDALEFGRKIVTLLHDADLRERMGQAGRAKAVAEYSVERCRDRYLALYNQVVSDQRVVSAPASPKVVAVR